MITAIPYPQISDHHSRISGWLHCETFLPPADSAPSTGRAVLCKESHCLLRRISKYTCFCISRTDGINRNIIMGIIKCSCFRHSHHSKFRCRLQSLTPLRHNSRDRGHIDQESSILYSCRGVPPCPMPALFTMPSNLPY